MSRLDLNFDEPPPTGPDFRVEVLEAMRGLNAALLDGDSATLTLEAWCGAAVTARRMRGIDSPAAPALREHLLAGPDEAVAYRHVQLVCGGHVLSEAENWYLPQRLTPDMRAQLDDTDAAFGRVILPLGPVRETAAVTLLWRPSPQVDSLQPGVPLFEHRARVLGRDGRPLAQVIETYVSDALAFRLSGDSPGR